MCARSEGAVLSNDLMSMTVLPGNCCILAVQLFKDGEFSFPPLHCVLQLSGCVNLMQSSHTVYKKPQSYEFWKRFQMLGSPSNTSDTEQFAFLLVTFTGALTISRQDYLTHSCTGATEYPHVMDWFNLDRNPNLNPNLTCEICSYMVLFFVLFL